MHAPIMVTIISPYWGGGGGGEWTDPFKKRLTFGLKEVVVNCGQPTGEDVQLLEQPVVKDLMFTFCWGFPCNMDNFVTGTGVLLGKWIDLTND